jgi:hypothetical protein
MAFPADAEYVVDQASWPFPLRVEDEKVLVWGQAPGGDYLQVVYLIEDDGTVFVIHARRLTEKEKRRLRRKKR